MYESITTLIQGATRNLLQRGVCYELAAAVAAFTYCNELAIVKVRFWLKVLSLCSDFDGQLGSVSRDYRVNTIASLDLAVYATVVLTLPVAAELWQDLMATTAAADPGTKRHQEAPTLTGIKRPIKVNF